MLLARFVQRKGFVLRETKNSVHFATPPKKLQTLAEAVQDLFVYLARLRISESFSPSASRYFLMVRRS